MLWLFVGPTGVYLLDFFCSSIQFNLLLSPCLCFISLLYLDLYVLGDDALISWGSFMRAGCLCVLIHIWIKGEVGAVKPVWTLQWDILLTVPRRCFFCGSFMLLFCLVLLCLCARLFLCTSVFVCFVVACWERADLLALVCGVYCEFVTFPLVFWVRCGTWLYRFLIFAPLLTSVFVYHFT